ncbi:MAG: hypothetical protein KME42_28305 [Tildeniella nuda ZEHNDER 1965/U140]|jgi:hypothetical protein|nr:hypothetical protein [Tildeniella nuda ZEHNDER 1965/U140]
MEPLEQLLSDWLDETFADEPETADGIRSHMHCCGDEHCKNQPVHFDNDGDGYCLTHWDYRQEDLAA